MNTRSLRTTRPREAHARDERGSVLVITLVAVVFIATTFTAIAAYENTTFRAQKSLVDKRSVDLAADGALDTTIAQLQSDLQAGVYADDGTGLSQACSNLATTGTAYPDPTLGSVVVTCHPANDHSGSRLGKAGTAPPNVIFTTGGSLGDGDDWFDVDTNTLPFCDDRQGTNSRCEAGLYVGNAVNDPGGLLITGNGANGNNPLVWSNGSMITRNAGATFVKGSVAARRACTNVTAGANFDLANNFFVFPVSQTSPTSGDTLTCGGLGAMSTPALRNIPIWKHNLWGTGPTTPMLAPAVQTLAMWDTGDGSGPGTPRCNDRFMKFNPGTYRDLTNLNDLMANCPAGTTFYFSPGTYYFDFGDVDVAGGANAWTGPTKFSQIVGGTPQGWTAAVGPQPPRRMSADTVVVNGPVTNDDGAITIGDADSAGIRLTPSTSGNASVKMGTISDPLPALGDSITKVEFRVAQTTTAGPSPTVRITFSSNSGSWCQFEVATATPIRTDPDGAKVYNITNSCPASAATSTSSWPPAWTATLVNDIGVAFAVTRADSTSTTNTTLDGMDVNVTYSGQPSPPYPGGCDPTNDGVQFIFGDLSRMRMVGIDVYLELCGSEGVPGASRYATAIYGLSADTVGPARDLVTDVPNAAPLSRIFTAISHDAPAKTTFENLDAPNDGTSASGMAGVDAWERIEYGNATPVNSVYATWTSGAPQLLAFNLDPQWIPNGSTIDKVEITVAHAEPQVDGSPLVPAPVLTVSAGTLNTNTDPDDASNVSNIVLNPLQTPVSGTIDGANYAGPYRVETFDVSQDLRTAAALNNALVKISYTGASPDAAKPKYAIVDGVEVHITYRPPTDLRPIRGCATIRLASGLNLSDYRGLDAVESQRPATTDASYEDGSGTKDAQQCSLMVVSSNKLGQGTKLHIAGSVYGPTAAFEFAGKDNEAQFLTDGIVARHITAMRWQQGPELPAFGGGTTSMRQPREVILEARVPGKPDPIATAKVQLTDPAGGPGRATAVIEDWRRRP